MRLAASSGEIVVAHSDWRAEHLRFEDEKIVAVYDWQSLAVGREPALPITRRRAAHASRRQSARPSAPPDSP
jgi:hypothetical protein